ncbi:MAG: acetyltransferase [Robiginitomaculum sp.]|nr:MAG: acetyltransferase [Robiginitomaculum sp.]
MLSVPQGSVENEAVVLLHGLTRTEKSLLVLQEVLRYVGFHVVNHPYPSTEAPIEALIPHVSDAVAQCGDRKINFVTHSLGGILTRAWLAQNQLPNLGRVVMMGPPNKGSPVVAEYNNWAAFKYVGGPASHQLGIDAGSFPNRLGAVGFELGVIAGRRSINPFFSSVIEGEDDGTVSVESTRVEGMTDHITLPVTHTLMMMNPMVIIQTVSFLRNGHFDHSVTFVDAVLRALPEKMTSTK